MISLFLVLSRLFQIMLSGKRRVLDCTTEFIAIRKDRYTFPVKLTVTHLAGVGEDSMFMGVILVRASKAVKRPPRYTSR